MHLDVAVRVIFPRLVSVHRQLIYWKQIALFQVGYQSVQFLW